MADRDVTVRRSIQQIKHCAEEALSIVEHDEDPRCAIDDLEQARDLLSTVIVRLKKADAR